jgi:hypothetical protein
MDFIGIDLHKNSGQVCVLTEDGKLIERRIKTDGDSLDKLFAERPLARILVESLTKSEWCVSHLEMLNYEVIVTNPTYAPMYATGDRRILRLTRERCPRLMRGVPARCLPSAHRMPNRQRDVRAYLSVREVLIHPSPTFSYLSINSLKIKISARLVQK